MKTENFSRNINADFIQLISPQLAKKQPAGQCGFVSIESIIDKLNDAGE